MSKEIQLNVYCFVFVFVNIGNGKETIYATRILNFNESTKL